MAQSKQEEWLNQWQIFEDSELFLFEDWIHPNSLTDFEGKTVLECGCGGGQHTHFVSDRALKVVAVDLNSIEVARERNRNRKNIEFVEADIAEMRLRERFDIVFSVGVIHHTDDPEKAIQNMIRHLKKGGRLIVWVYSREGNWIVENVVERFRRRFLRNSSTTFLLFLSRVLTLGMYIPIYTLYMLPIRILPYYEYFRNFRRLSFTRNTLNVFDKLNAPQVHFISQERVNAWFDPERFEDVHISNYRGVSWQASATLATEDLEGNIEPN